MKSALITGITGFTGKHLVEYLLSLDEEIDLYGISRTEGLTLPNVKCIRANLVRANDVMQVFRRLEPNYIFHLAACNHGEPQEMYATNVLGTINLLEAVKDMGKKSPIILLVGSCAEYGIVDKTDLPIKESTPLKPVSFYGNSKVAQDFIGLQYFITHGLNVIRVRPTNIIGPGQSKKYVCSAFASQIVAIERGTLNNSMEVGNLTPQRDFLDVRDAIDAYWRLINIDSFGDVFNICSGTTVCPRDVLNNLLSLTAVKPTIISSSKPTRSGPIMLQSYNYDKVNKATGWVPNKTLRNSLEEILEYWRNIQITTRSKRKYLNLMNP